MPRGLGASPQRVQGRALALLLLLTAASPPKNIQITDAFARATAPGQSTGGVFLTLTSQTGDTLDGATTPAAPHVSLHRMTMSGDVMQMRELRSVPLPPGKPVAFTPGQMHLMLERLPQPLRAGQTIHLTLDFARAGHVAVDVPVAGPGARMPPMPGMN